MSEFLNSDAGKALSGLLIVAFLDFVTGTFAALRDGTFALDAIAAFVRKHILGRVAPIGTLLVVGYYGGDPGRLFLAGAIAAAAAYVAETAASIWGNVNPPKEGDLKRAAEEEMGVTDADRAAGVQVLIPPINPVPED